MKVNRFLVGLLLAALAVAVAPVHQPAQAQSSSIRTRNSWLRQMDNYRSASSAKDRCFWVDMLRSSGVDLMEQGDASLARQFNSFLPRTGCRKSPIVIDPSAKGSSTVPGPNEGGAPPMPAMAGGGCTISIAQMEEFRRTRRMVLYC